MNPLLPEILDSHQADNQVSLKLKVAEDLACFPGHFPGFPILPGSVVELSLTFETGKNRLGFSYSQGENRCSSGLILLTA